MMHSVINIVIAQEQEYFASNTTTRLILYSALLHISFYGIPTCACLAYCSSFSKQFILINMRWFYLLLSNNSFAKKPWLAFTKMHVRNVHITQIFTVYTQRSESMFKLP